VQPKNLLIRGVRVTKQTICS